MTAEPRILRIVPLTRVIDGRLCWLVVGSLSSGRPEWKPDPALERKAQHGNPA